MKTPCGPNISKHGDIPEDAADALAARMMNLARQVSERDKSPITEALKDVAGEFRATESMGAKIAERNALLTIQAKRNVKSFVDRFQTMGEGLQALLVGSNKKVPGARNSIDYQSKSLHGEYFGRLVDSLDKAGVLHDFVKGDKDFVQDVYREMGNLRPGDEHSGPVTKNQNAFVVAKTIDGLYEELVARQNRAGAYINRLPGYITRQTHDQDAIRALGGVGSNTQSKEKSFEIWSKFVYPLLDPIGTFKGAEPDLVLRNIHEGLYSGMHGIAPDEANVSNIMVRGSIADKVSQDRVLHFKGPDEAFKYNQAFGIKEFKEAILTDLHQRTRSIALMENLGPSPEATMKDIVRELSFDARVRDDAAKQMDSLRDWRIMGAMNELTGRNEVPSNPGLNRFISTAKTLTQMAKMGAVSLSKFFADKAFTQSEMMYQGMNQLQVLGKQLTQNIFPHRSPEEKSFLRLMGVAMDGIMGNSLSRYSNHSTVSGWSHKVQKLFFDINGLNMITDAHKASAGELMAAHLGENSHLSFDELPGDLSKVLSLYDITSSRWDALRSTAYTPEGSIGKFITPDLAHTIPEETIKGLIAESGKKATDANVLRERDRLETSLRTYLADRIDIAVPSGGAKERMYATMNTQAGTPVGEAMRMIMLFKSFPLTIMDKIVARNIYGNGANSLKEWLMNDHKGKFNLAMLMAMGTAGGYLSGVARDALGGKNPKPLYTDQGPNWEAINDSAIRGGSLGILGDMLLSDYDRNFKTFLGAVGGPILGQADAVMALKGEALAGKSIAGPAGKLLLDNAPLINLFYLRPMMNYLVLWNLEEMLSPGTLRKRESAVERKNHQDYFLKPSQLVNQ